MKRSDPPIIIEETFECSVEKLWDALTKVDLMTEWYFENIPAFEANVGFTTQFEVTSGDRIFTHVWTVTTVEAQRKLSYGWEYEEYEGKAEVTFEVSEAPDGSRLKLSLIVLADFDEHVPEFKRESCIQGWNYFLVGRLQAYLDQ